MNTAKLHSRFEFTPENDVDIALLRSSKLPFDGIHRVFYTQSYDQYLSIIGIKENGELAQEGPSYATEPRPSYPIPPVPEGLSLFPFQIAGAQFLAAKNKALLADEPGSGKTIQVISALNLIYTPDLPPILIFCPASLVLNWRDEIFKWATFNPRVCTEKVPPSKGRADIFIYSIDSASRIFTEIDITKLPGGVDEKVGRLRSGAYEAPSVVVVDEAHLVKSYTAKRTTAIYAVLRTATLHAWLLTGTPLLAKTLDLFPMLSFFFPRHPVFSDREKFGTTHCGRRLSRVPIPGGHGATRAVYVENENRNLHTINEMLRNWVMIRRSRRKILPQLPDKFTKEVIIPVKSSEIRAEIKAFDLLVKRYGTVEEAIARAIGNESHVDLGMFAKSRANVGLLKLKEVIAYSRDLLDNGTEKIIIFAHHKEAIKRLEEGLKEFNPMTIDGGTPLDKRHENVKLFQDTTSSCRVAILSIRAASTGLTLTASHDVIFAELDFNDATMQQASDRAYRIGQTENVTVHIILLENSLDERLYNLILKKQRSSEEVLK